MPYRIQEVGDFQTFYPYYTERANLLSFQIIYSLAGEGHLDYKDMSFTIKPGQIFIINCMEHHVYYTPIGTTWDTLWVHFYGENVLPVFKEINSYGYAPFTVNNKYQMETWLRRILTLNQEKSLGYEVQSSNIINEILTEMLMQVLTTNEPITSVPKDIEAVINYIEQHYQESLSLDELASRFGISKYHLARKFKATTRITVNEFIILTRINFARHRLRESDDTVTSIAYECGMNNVSHFINLFKEREGLTPLTYRKVWLSDGKKDYGYVGVLG